MNNDYSKYSIGSEIEFEPLELLDFPAIISTCKNKWQNKGISRVNDCVIRLGVVEGEFHWHKHEKEDEFFYVIDGLLFIDLEEQTIELHPQQGFLIPKGINHRTRAPKRTAMLMVEGYTVKATGD
ncbi:MAG: cupin domain-containing protein [Candidatus Thorarchaeota archaeon]